MKFFYTILGLLILACVFQAGFHAGKEKTGEVTDTIVVRDTLRPDPVVIRDTFLRYKTIALHDTITKDSLIFKAVGDSVKIPITQRTYSDDSTYTAWVSGFEPALDSISIYRKTTFIRDVVTKRRLFDFGIGVTGGISVITGKPDVTAGATVVIHF